MVLFNNLRPSLPSCFKSHRHHATTNTTSVHLSPFTPSILSSIQSSLQPPPTFPPTSPPPHTVISSRTPSEAAILIPLVNIDEKPCILLEVRSAGLRVHAGEVSFPGGKADHIGRREPSDHSLRETHEELALLPANVQILGLLHGPEYSLGNRARVWPFVGFVHSSAYQAGLLLDASPRDARVTNHPDVESNSPLPSFAISSLHPSPQEVSALLPLPLSALLTPSIAGSAPSRQSLHFFRMDPLKPYWKIRVDDLAHPPTTSPTGHAMNLDDAARIGEIDDRHGGDHSSGVGGNKGRALEVWGLSGWFLNRLAWQVGWLTKPKVQSLNEF